MSGIGTKYFSYLQDCATRKYGRNWKESCGEQWALTDKSPGMVISSHGTIMMMTSVSRRVRYWCTKKKGKESSGQADLENPVKKAVSPSEEYGAQNLHPGTCVQT